MIYLPAPYVFILLSVFCILSAGDLVKTVIPGGDEGIAAEVKRLFPVLPLDDVKRAITEWRTATKSS